MSLKRYTNGITDLSASDPMGQLGMLDPRKYAVFMEDFLTLGCAAISSSTIITGNATITSSANNTTTLVTDAGGKQGCLSCVSTAADNESTLWQGLMGGMRMVSGKKFFMETSFEITAAAPAQNELVIGVTSPHAAGAGFFATDGTARGFDDGLAFVSVDAGAGIDLLVGEADVFDTLPCISLIVTATWYKLSVYYDGTKVHLYKDDALLSSTTPDQIPISVVCPVIWYKTGAAAVQTLLVDYLFVAAER